MGQNNTSHLTNNRVLIVTIALLLSIVLIIVTTPIHEAAHWVMSDIDPYIEPTEFHLFDEKSFQHGENILSSALGCVVVKEKYPGAFEDRLMWADLFQELICICIQILIACIIVKKTLKFLFLRNRKIVSATTSS